MDGVTSKEALATAAGEGQNHMTTESASSTTGAGCEACSGASLQDVRARRQYTFRENIPKTKFKYYIVIVGVLFLFTLSGLLDDFTVMMARHSSSFRVSRSNTNLRSVVGKYENTSISDDASNGDSSKPLRSRSQSRFQPQSQQDATAARSQLYPEFVGRVARMPKEFKSMPRGFQVAARHASGAQNQGDERLSVRPLQSPTFEDPGESYLAFNKSLVGPEFRSAPTLRYDVNVVRLSDTFGLVDDMLTNEELERTFQRVVDIFAQANIYVRVNRRDFATAQRLSHKKALVYLGYVEGPDLAEQVDMQKPESSRISKGAKRNAFVKWFRAEMRESFPVPSVELLLRGPKKGLTSNGGSESKHDVADTLSDWAFGFPNLFPPWDLAHTTSLFPVYYFHQKSGSSNTGGRIIARTGTCLPLERPAPISASKYGGNEKVDDTGTEAAASAAVDSLPAPKMIYEGKMVKCKGFEPNMFKRVQADVVRPQQASDNIPMNDPVALGRVFAHELAHSMMLLHPGGSSTCTIYPFFHDGNLMMPVQFVGMKNNSACNNGKVRIDQFKADKLTPRQQSALRDFVKLRDVRQTNTLPGSITVGGSTEQIATQSPYFYDRILRNSKNAMTGSGKKLAAQTTLCKMPQAVVVLNRIPAPTDGRVMRVRWLPTRFSIVNNSVHILVLRSKSLAAGDPLLTVDDPVNFEVVQRTQKTLTVPASTQNAHIEVDVNEDLRMRKGDILAIATMKSRRLNVDTQVFFSDKVLYADVVGQFQRPATNFFDALAPFESTPNTYPRIAVAPYEQDAFFGTATPFDPTQNTLTARKANSKHPEEWCAQPVANFDLLPTNASTQNERG